MCVLYVYDFQYTMIHLFFIEIFSDSARGLKFCYSNKDLTSLLCLHRIVCNMLFTLQCLDRSHRSGMVAKHSVNGTVPFRTVLERNSKARTFQNGPTGQCERLPF